MSTKPDLSTHKTLALAVAFTLALSVGACNEPASQDTGPPEGLLVVPVFGEAREDVSADLAFAGLRAGVVSEERRMGDLLVGFRFAEELRPDDRGVLPLQDGEIGVSLGFADGNFSQHTRHTVPPATDGHQRLEISVEAARIDLTVDGIEADDVVVIGYDAPNGGGRASRGADNYGGRWYFPPGEITLSVGLDGVPTRDSRTVTLAAGESAPITLTVPR